MKLDKHLGYSKHDSAGQNSGNSHRKRQVTPKKASARNKASRRARSAARENTKTAKVIALLQQPEGATLQAIMGATRSLC